MGVKQLLITLFLFLLLLPNIVLAQADFLSTIGSLLGQYVGIIFIIIFVFILLLIGGAIKLPTSGFSFSLIMFLVLIVLAFVLPQFISFPDYMTTVPDSFKYWEFPEGAKDALLLIGLPREWGYVPAIIYLFILPFAAIYALVWSFLTTLAIIPQSNVNKLLALIIAFLTIPMGWFVKMVWSLFSFMGAWSVAIFAATFVAGIFFRGAGITAKEHAEFRKHIQMGKKGAGEMLRRLKEARKGRVDDMRVEANYVIQAAPALNLGIRAVQHLKDAGNPGVPDQDVPKHIDEAIRELEKEI